MIFIILIFGGFMFAILNRSSANNTTANITKFEPVNADRIKLKFEQLKCGNEKAVKVFNTAQFGLINVDVYKGESYSDNGLNFIEIRKDNKTICVFDEMSNNDLILSLMLLKRL